MDDISVILTVYNQEEIIERVCRGIAENVSSNTKELIVLIDGCTDRSEEIIYSTLREYPIFDITTIERTPNLNETLANNHGLRKSKYDYSIIVQDDCVITDKNFDLRMLKPFKLVPNLLAVSGRDAVDVRLINGKVDFYNVAGADVNTARNIFSIRDAVNRSPLMLDNAKLKQLNYLDESFAPLNADDVDLSIRGYINFGYLVGSYVISFISDVNWGTTRKNPKSCMINEATEIRNLNTIAQRYHDFIIGEKHSQDLEIEDD